jgi:hypothetical protein
MKRRPLYYILADRVPVPCDVVTWGLWFCADDDRRVVAQTELPGGDRVSTVFVGVDTACMGPPGLFETMVDAAGRRSFRKHATWEEAETAHWALVKQCAAPLN